MKIVLLGAPLCGKGSQAGLIKEYFKIPHISTGEIFRTIMSGPDTDLKKEIQTFMNNGTLVPDDITIKLVKDRISKDDCKDGYILDGFPRTIYQAEQFSKIDDIDAVVYIEDTLENILKRIAGRRICPNCKKVFALRNYNSLVCDVCKSELVKRDDDNEETVRIRHDVYLKNTFPLVEYYEKKGLLKKVVGLDSIADTFEVIKKILLKIENDKIKKL